MAVKSQACQKPFPETNGLTTLPKFFLANLPLKSYKRLLSNRKPDQTLQSHHFSWVNSLLNFGGVTFSYLKIASQKEKSSSNHPFQVLLLLVSGVVIPKPECFGHFERDFLILFTTIWGNSQPVANGRHEISDLNNLMPP